MYVQIDKKFRDSLQENVIAMMYMGSHAHGLADDESDEDIIYVYFDTDHGKTIFNETNGWQYRNGNVDENYQELRVFIHNLITAKMCGNLEAILDGWESIEDSLEYEDRIQLDELFTMLRKIRSYALIKSYLGYAKKDIKNARKMLDGGCPLDSRDLRKKLAHIMRGIDTVGYLLNGSPYSFNRRSKRAIKISARQIKRGHDITLEDINDILDGNEKNMQSLRDDVNKNLDEHTIYRRGDPTKLSLISKMLTSFVLNVSDQFKPIEYSDTLRLDILEKGETHQYH